MLGFSAHSLPHPYARTFLRRIVLRHPARVLLGICRYWRLQPASNAQEYRLSDSTEDTFVPRVANDAERLLVATGFCQKPLPEAGAHVGCPARRFNHDCVYLVELELGPPAENPADGACEDCFVRVLGHAALRAGASFAVLTSALDIAKQVLIPAIEERRFTHVLMALCPYSLEPMSLALQVSDVDGYLFAFNSGACSNYQEWLGADRGDKLEQTTLSAPGTSRLFRLLRAIAHARTQLGLSQPTSFESVDHIYRPVGGRTAPF